MKQCLLFDLDLLLDTRIATLGSIDPAIATAIVSDPDKSELYRKRINNQFLEFGLKKGQFDMAFKKRNVDILMQSRPTRFLFELRDIGYELIKKATMEPHNVEDIVFHINFYPYHDLTDDERDTIIAAIKCRVQDSISLVGVYYPPSQLSPIVIRSEGYSGIFFQDYTTWINCHYGKDKLEQDIIPIPSVTINTPLLFNDVDQLQMAIDFRNPRGEQCNPLLGLRAMFAPYFFLDALDLSGLSIIQPNDFVEREIT